MIKAHITLPSLNRREAIALTASASTAGLWSYLPAHAQDQSPKKGGKMVLASRHGSTTDSTDPGLLTNAYQGLLALSFSNTLTEILPDGSVGPVLAESWDSKDGKTWRFSLRKGVTFHDGRTMKAEDVVASINHHRAADSKSYIKPVADQFTEVKTDGENAVIITLQTANADLPAILNTEAFTIYPAKGEKMDWETRNGTGPYILKEYQPGISAHLERNPQLFPRRPGLCQ